MNSGGSSTPTCTLLPADLTSDAELRTVEDFLAGAANLQMLVNNAGFGTHGAVL